MIKKLHGLDGYSFMTTPALIKYFAGKKIYAGNYQNCGYFIDFNGFLVFIPMDKYLVLHAVLNIFKIGEALKKI